MICLDEGIFTNIGGAPVAWFLLVFDSVVNSMIFLSNLMILIAVRQFWTHGKVPQNANSSTILVANLSVSSIIMSISACYYYSHNFFCSIQKRANAGFWPCMLKFSFIATAHYATAFLNIAIAVDRYLAIVHIMMYERWVTPKRVKWTVAIIWFISLLEAQSLLVWNNWEPGIPCYDRSIYAGWYMIIFWHLGSVIQLTTITSLHWRIHLVTKRVKQRSTEQPVTAFNNKPGQTMISVVPIYLVTWGPYIIAMICSMAGVQVSHDVINLCATFSGLNYLLIPIRYSLYNVVVKNALCELLSLFAYKWMSKDICLWQRMSGT